MCIAIYKVWLTDQEAKQVGLVYFLLSPRGHLCGSESCSNIDFCISTVWLQANPEDIQLEHQIQLSKQC